MPIKSLGRNIQDLIQVIEIDNVVKRVDHHFALVDDYRTVTFGGATRIAILLFEITIVNSTLKHLIFC
jgi:hypothetical protein